MRNKHLQIFTALLMCHIFIPSGLCLPDQVESVQNRETRELLRVGFHKNIFSEVDLRDAQMALEIWMQQIAADQGSNYKFESLIFDDLSSLEQAVLDDAVDLVNITGLDYLRLTDNLPLTPEIAPVKGDSALETYILVTHKDSGISQLKHLEGKKLILHSGGRGYISRFWLDYLLLKEELNSMVDFFSTVKEVDKSSQAILPVFFGQADVCLVPKDSFDTLVDLNPQIIRDLRIMHESPGFIFYISCFRKDYSQETRKHFRDTAFELHKNPEGQQILTLFHLEKVMPFKHVDLESLKTIIEEYNKMVKDKSHD